MWNLFALIYNATVATIVLTFSLFMLSFIHPVFGFIYRLIISYFALVTAAAYGVFISLVLRITVGHGRLAQWNTGRVFAFLMRWGAGISFTIEDPNNYLGMTRPAVFIGNHQTELDVLMLGHIFPPYCSVTAKKSLKQIPVLGWFMSLSGSVFIDRQNSSSARNAMAGAAEDMNRYRQSVYMFPEGTRSYYKEAGLLPFKKGAFHLAVQAQVPIVPVVVANYSNILYLKTWTFRSGNIAIKGIFTSCIPIPIRLALL